MGQSMSSAREGIFLQGDREATEQALQDMDILHKAMELQLDQFDSQFEEKSLSQPSSTRSEIPFSRSTRKERFTNVQIKDGPKRTISRVIDSLFNHYREEYDRAVFEGFKEVVENALAPFMHTTDIGQYEEKKYFIFVIRDTLVRIDVMIWRWNFTKKGFSNNIQSATGYVLYTSVVDESVLETSEFVSLISLFSNGGNSKQYVNR
ncbi:hypothetical protein F53441_9530 [Fusarium austroafricanum]|uniref:Uncharacterized protein n=1 Tax=Fusarium austroafricanum TaxID=2364996 RepID=A0A8H4KBM4_9HYPO|nr:hypothetical protein F53441_9530 [Fusarium austroafricanum]